MQLTLRLQKFYKTISLITRFGHTLEEHNPTGDIFCIQDGQFNLCGSAKKFLYLPEESKFLFKIFPYSPKLPTATIETYSEVYGYDEGFPDRYDTKIYVLKNCVKSNQDEGTDFPVFLISQNGIETLARGVIIKGRSSLIYDLGNAHPIGGKVWLETDAEIELIQKY